MYNQITVHSKIMQNMYALTTPIPNKKKNKDLYIGVSLELDFKEETETGKFL